VRLTFWNLRVAGWPFAHHKESEQLAYKSSYGVYSPLNSKYESDPTLDFFSPKSFGIFAIVVENEKVLLPSRNFMSLNLTVRVKGGACLRMSIYACVSSCSG